MSENAQVRGAFFSPRLQHHAISRPGGAAFPAALHQGPYRAPRNSPRTGGMMQNTPPSDEAFLELYEVAGKVLARPGETVRAVFVHILVDGPDGDRGRWIISPRDAYEAVLRIVDREIHEVLDAS